MPGSFVPTEEQRQKVKAMAGFGLKQEQIAILLELGSVVTLRKHFRQELTRGPIEAKVNVRKTLFKMVLVQTSELVVGCDNDGNVLIHEWSG